MLSTDCEEKIFSLVERVSQVDRRKSCPLLASLDGAKKYKLKKGLVK